MNCVKCGVEIGEGQYFCCNCLDVMKKYPVKPGIAIQLPGKKDSPGQKKSYVKKKQVVSADEQIQRLRRRIRGLTAAWLITLLLLAAAAYPVYAYFTGQRLPLPGQNYTTITDAGPSEG